MSFEIIGDALNDPTVRSYIYTVIGVLFAFIVLILVRFIARSAAKRKVGSISDGPAMSMMDIDQMRKRGLISEQEFKSIRHSLAGSEVDRERRRKQSERERAILAQVERDPDAARLLLEPAAEDEEPPKPRPLAKARPAGQQARPEAPVQAKAQQARPEVQQARSVAPTREPATPAKNSGGRIGELDMLLQKGAITPEEYERLKSFFK